MGRINESAASHTDESRTVEAIAVGQWFGQGDISIRRIEAKDVSGEKTTERQLAPGTSKGSRHIVEGNVTVLAPKTDDPLRGPYLRASERFTVTHPEHGDVCLPKGDYAVTYQRDFAMEERARVAD